MAVLEKKYINEEVNMVNFIYNDEIDSKLKEAENDFLLWKTLDFDDFFISTLNFKNNLYKNV